MGVMRVTLIEQWKCDKCGKWSPLLNADGHYPDGWVSESVKIEYPNGHTPGYHDRSSRIVVKCPACAKKDGVT